MSNDEFLPPSAIIRVENLVRDARLSIMVGIIPILGLIFLLRLVQWYLLKRQFPILMTEDAGEHSGLAHDFRWALPCLWFAVLFWFCLFIFIIIYCSAPKGFAAVR